MTSEICLMNRRAAVLAADSAITVTSWNKMQLEERYFKGANKIFEVSKKHPVAAMFYDSASILSVPCETIIKEFRRERGDKTFNRVMDFRNEFVDFANHHNDLFPADVKKENFANAARSAIRHAILKHDEAAKEDSSKKFSESLRIISSEARSTPLVADYNDESASELKGAWGDHVAGYIHEMREIAGFELDIEDGEIADIAMDLVLRDIGTSRNSTGLVFCGFGDSSVFPEMVHNRQCGFVGDRFYFSSSEDGQVTHSIPSYISAFAQTSMTDTFLLGFSPDIFSFLMDCVAETARELMGKAARDIGLDKSKLEHLARILVESNSEIRDKVIGEAREKHAVPMRSVLAMLPVDEMATLAETLIDLQSLKEKVTKPSETVGGPIDVAAITRSEGLVWIKRKHFFDGSLNSRYLNRLSSEYK